MNKYVSIGALGALCVTLMSCFGCSALLGLIQPSSVTVKIINSGTFPVDSTFYIDDDENILELLIKELGTKIENTVQAGESTSFSRSCSDLGAIILDDADLQIVGSVGPDTNADILREGEDFSCGDTIVFTFTHSAVLLDFGVAVTVQPFSLSTGG